MERLPTVGRPRGECLLGQILDLDKAAGLPCQPGQAGLGGRRVLRSRRRVRRLYRLRGKKGDGTCVMATERGQVEVTGAESDPDRPRDARKSEANL